MSNVVVVDTDILIDAGRDISDAVACLQAIEGRASPAVSAVSQMELIIGCRNKAELRATERFLERFQLIKLNEVISDTAADLLRRYRLSHGLHIADALIAAKALSLDVPLATKNQRDYRFVDDLHLLAYPRPFGGDE